MVEEGSSVWLGKIVVYNWEGNSLWLRRVTVYGWRW